MLARCNANETPRWISSGVARLNISRLSLRVPTLPRNTRVYIKTAQYECATQYPTRQIGRRRWSRHFYFPPYPEKSPIPPCAMSRESLFYDGWYNQSSREPSCAARRASDYFAREMVYLSVRRIIFVLGANFLGRCIHAFVFKETHDRRNDFRLLIISHARLLSSFLYIR